jgi:hypothetical protein
MPRSVQHPPLLLKFLGLAAFLAAGQALALALSTRESADCGPPAGAILDLHGTAVPNSYTQYSVQFTATNAVTNISFAFREDPAFLILDDISVIDLTTPSGNLLVNGGFETGTASSWVVLNTFGATFAGVVLAGVARTGTFAWYDGSVQGYDGITQSIATNVGELYEISFWLNDNGPLTTFSRLSTNGNVTNTGGNGIDLLVYAGAVPTIPEPASLALLGIGLAGLGFSRRRKQN